jgi:protein-S-isoprenylcysteine O-methyltransferase Ste14
MRLPFLRVTMDRDNAGVVALPPLILLIACVLVGALGWLAPLHVGLGAARWAGAALLAGALALRVWSSRELTRAGTNVDPRKPTHAVVASGPFAYTRNPIYLAQAAILLGEGVLLDSAWTAAVFAAWFAVMRAGVVAREERYMALKFGEAYLAYRARVRRWV